MQFSLMNPRMKENTFESFKKQKIYWLLGYLHIKEKMKIIQEIYMGETQVDLA